jgi:HSP20 family molecular chaperone IbpA
VNPAPDGGAGAHAEAGRVCTRTTAKVAFAKDFAMSRMSLLSSPLLLGFEEIERLVDRIGKGGDAYPPYNIERIVPENGNAEALRITLALAGFARDQLEITLEDNQLAIRGKQVDEAPREYLHRGIAARQFQRTFVLADGIEVRSADLENGLLTIDLVRREPERLQRRIEIGGRKRASEPF